MEASRQSSLRSLPKGLSTGAPLQLPESPVVRSASFLKSKFFSRSASFRNCTLDKAGGEAYQLEDLIALVFVGGRDVEALRHATQDGLV